MDRDCAKNLGFGLDRQCAWREGSMMTITMGSMTPKKERPRQSAEMEAATELVRMAKEQGLALTTE